MARRSIFSLLSAQWRRWLPQSVATSCAAVMAIVLSACTSIGTYAPTTSQSYIDRSQTQTEGPVRVTASVPNASETREIFGAQLYRQGIQPILLEINNNSSRPLRFLPSGTEPLYFTPSETAIRIRTNGNTSEVLQLYNDSLGKVTIPPGETRAGFIFSELDEGTKTFNVDLLNNDNATYSFTFFIDIPGLRIDHQRVDWANLYPADQWQDIHSPSALNTALETQRCCTSDKSGKEDGDPLNIVVIGTVEDVYYAFLRAGWDETETVNANSLIRTAGSFLTGGNYRYSPVSGLYVLGRTQDIAFQRTRTSINERNHLRLWLIPVRYRGTPVFVGQISRDIGVRFSRRTITTHEIDPDVDETREYLLENLAYSQALKAYAYVGGVGEATIQSPRTNITDSPYFTDGNRIVLWISSEPTSIDDILVLDLQNPEQR